MTTSPFLFEEIGTWSFDPVNGVLNPDANLRRIFGVPEAIDLDAYLARLHPEDLPGVKELISNSLDRQIPYEAAYRVLRDGEVRYVIARGRVENGRMTGMVVDVTQRHLAERALAAEKHVLEMIATGVKLSEVLEFLAKGIEEQSEDGMLVSVLLLDKSGRRLLHGAAPSLPKQYNDKIHGIEIGPTVGSCGTAAYSGRRVSVNDIANDPLWADFKELAISFGLRACWSYPILATDGTTLGTMAMYYPKPHQPSRHDQQLMETATHLAGIVLQRERSEAALRESVQEFKLLANAIPQFAWMAHPDGEIFWYNERFYEFTGRTPAEMAGEGWKLAHHPAYLSLVMDRWEDCLRTGKPFEMEYPLLGADGSYRSFLTRIEPLKDDSGKILRWFGTNTDVEELRRYREEREQLLESQARLTYFLRAANRSIAQISFAHTEEEITAILLELLVTTFRAKAVAIWHQEQRDGNYLLLKAAHQLQPSTPMFDERLDIRFNPYKPGWVARYGKPFAGRIEPGDLQFDHSWLKSNELQYAAILPIMHREKVVGVMAYLGQEELPATVPEVLTTVAAVYGRHVDEFSGS